MSLYISYSQDSLIIDTDELTWKWEKTTIMIKLHFRALQRSKKRLRRRRCIIQDTYLSLKPGSSVHTLSLPESMRPAELWIPLYFFIVVVVQSISCAQLFVILWAAACQASLSFTISQTLLRFMSIESVMPSNHLIFCLPLLPFAFNLSQHQGLLQWVNFSLGGQSIRASASASVLPMNI